MIIKIRGKDVAISTGSQENDEAVAAFFSVALHYAARHAEELELPSTGTEYWDVADQFSGVVYY